MSSEEKSGGLKGFMNKRLFGKKKKSKKGKKPIAAKGKQAFQFDSEDRDD
jgi:hypothetical protein